MTKPFKAEGVAFCGGVGGPTTAVEAFDPGVLGLGGDDVGSLSVVSSIIILMFCMRFML